MRFTWGTSRRAAEAALAFRGWLQGDAGRAALLDVGLRPVGTYAVRSPLENRSGTDARPALLPQSPPRRRAAPTRVDVAAARGQDRSVQPPGRVLLVLDASRSMAGPVNGSGSRFAVVAQGVKDSVEQMGVQDLLGLWVLPGQRAAPYRILMDLGPADRSRDGVIKALDGVRPAGGTPLYSTLLAAARRVGGGPESAVVVLTDGEDTTSPITAELARGSWPAYMHASS